MGRMFREAGNVHRRVDCLRAETGISGDAVQGVVSQDRRLGRHFPQLAKEARRFGAAQAAAAAAARGGEWQAQAPCGRLVPRQGEAGGLALKELQTLPPSASW